MSTTQYAQTSRSAEQSAPTRPPDVTAQLKETQRTLAAAREQVKQAEQRVVFCKQQVDATSGLTRLRASGRWRHGQAERNLRSAQQTFEHRRGRPPFRRSIRPVAAERSG
jgi:hypothetical protein